MTSWIADGVFYKNWPDAKPGHLTKILADRKVSLTVADVEAGEIPPISDFDLAIFGGAPLDPNAQDTGTLGQIEQIRIGLAQNKPILGICRGWQLLVLAAGGRVVPSPVAEYGMFDPTGAPFTVELPPKDQQDPLFRGLGAEQFRVFQMHNMMCDVSGIPATILGTGKYCRNQVGRIGSGYGIQSHIEFSPAMMEYFVSKVSDFQELGPDLLAQFQEFYDDYYRTARVIVNNFLDTAGVPR